MKQETNENELKMKWKWMRKDNKCEKWRGKSRGDFSEISAKNPPFFGFHGISVLMIWKEECDATTGNELEYIRIYYLL